LKKLFLEMPPLTRRRAGGKKKKRSPAARPKNPSVLVLVLGDVGRSPRMQYHIASLRKAGFTVDVIGYSGSPLMKELRQDKRVRVKTIVSFYILFLPFFLAAPIKVFMDIVQIFWLILFRTQTPESILVQNPPAVPALMVGWWAAKLLGTTMIVDWHNFGYTILALKRNPKGWSVRLYEWLEFTFGKLANGAFCVTHAMRKTLRKEREITALVLPDRPRNPAKLPLTDDEKHKLFLRLQDTNAVKPESHMDIYEWRGNGADTTVFTAKGKTRADAPLLLVSSTSWTPDEEISMLLKCLPGLDKELETKNLRAVIVITGKDDGKLKAKFFDELEDLNLSRIRVLSLFLAYSDYLSLLRAADFGLCFHSSSSGIDLPMKVIDMFEAGLPVLARHFDTLEAELITDGKTGFTFKDETELLDRMKQLVATPKLRDDLREAIVEWSQGTWQAQWEAVALPEFKRVHSKRPNWGLGFPLLALFLAFIHWHAFGWIWYQMGKEDAALSILQPNEDTIEWRRRQGQGPDVQNPTDVADTPDAFGKEETPVPEV